MASSLSFNLTEFLPLFDPLALPPGSSFRALPLKAKIRKALGFGLLTHEGPTLWNEFSEFV